jgi:hypothetical protein
MWKMQQMAATAVVKQEADLLNGEAAVAQLKLLICCENSTLRGASLTLQSPLCGRALQDELI